MPNELGIFPTREFEPRKRSFNWMSMPNELGIDPVREFESR